MDNQWQPGILVKGLGQRNAPTPEFTKAVNETTSSKIRDGVSYLENQVSEAHSLISALEARLETVLVPVPPQPAPVNQAGPAGPPMSHLFDRLQSLSHSLNEMENRLRTLMSRIEV